MSEIKNFVNEVFVEAPTLKDQYEYYFRATGIRKLSEKESDESFFESRKPKMLEALWHSAFDLSGSGGINKYNSIRYHYCKMSITKYIAVHPDKIGKDKTFYFLGKRHTKVSDVNKLCEHYGWTWEKKNPKLANFFILGDNPSRDEAELNKYLSKPVVMDDDLRVQMHFLFNDEVTLEDLDNEQISLYLNSKEYAHLKLVISMIQYIKDGVLSDANKIRLIRSYVSTFTNTPFELNNKEHVWMSDTVQRYCHPQHRYLVTNHFLKYLKGRYRSWNVITTNTDLGRVNIWDCNGPAPGGKSVHYTWQLLHSAAGDTEVMEADLLESNSYSIVPKPVYTPNKRYCNVQTQTIIDKSVYKIIFTIDGNEIIVCAVCIDTNKVIKLLDFGFISNTWRDVDESIPQKNLGINWRSEYRPTLVEMLESLISSNVVFNRDNSAQWENDTKYNLIAYKIDKFLTENRIYNSEQEREMSLLKMKARATAVSST